MITYDSFFNNLSTPSKNVQPKIVSPPPEKIPIPLNRKTSSTRPPPLYPNHHAPWLLSNFLHLNKQTINTQLCNRKICIIP